MVRASYRSSEGCGFDPRLGLRNKFLSIELEDCSSTLKMGKLARTPKFNMELVCPGPIHSHGNDQSLELSIHQRPIAHSQTMAFCLLLHSLDVQIGYPNRISTTQVDVSGHVLTMGNTIGDNVY